MQSVQPINQDIPSARRHDLDALRAFAMLLGIVLHAALSFIDAPWVVQDQQRAPEMSFVVSAIHGFRMPLFFLLSGFFTAMLWKKRGLGALLKHRAMRIALPLGIGWMIIAPTMLPIWIWAELSNTTSIETRALESDTSKDIWAAAAQGDTIAIQEFITEGISADGEDPEFGHSPLAWAVIFDQQNSIDTLLDAGADPNAQYRDQNAPMHTAAFFGRATAVDKLLAAGALPNPINKNGETPIDAMRHGKETTNFIAGIFGLQTDFKAVSEGRATIRVALEEGIERLNAESPGLQSDGNTGGSIKHASRMYNRLFVVDFFLHLWFLWFLCWLVAGFAIAVLLLKALPPIRIHPALIKSPICLLWLIPLTMLTQSYMHAGGSMPGFGPDTSTGILPMPHVLAHHAIFFGFGALLFSVTGTEKRIGTAWWIQLPIALLLLPAAIALSLKLPWIENLAGDIPSQTLLANLGQTLYVWLMIFGLIGLCERLLSREHKWIRYISDSSYWLYIVHLPLVIIGQILLRNAELPAHIKLLILMTTVTAILLISYHYLVRYTFIGRTLNGPRTRPQQATK